MKAVKYIIYFFCVCYTLQINAQEQEVQNDSIDYKYREDQFYLSITYDLLGRLPSGMSQSNFSSGFHFGVIRDMPINKRRNLAIGVGLGVSLNSINNNLYISKNNQGGFNYSLIGSDQFNKNKFTLQMVEVPVEIRWRNSTPVKYNFWRIYTGIKMGYVVVANSKFEGMPQDAKFSILDAVNRFQFGLTMGVGYGAINAYANYGLNAVLKDSELLNGESLEFNTIKIGLILYIL